MTGLEKILADIAKEADTAASALVTEAEDRASAIKAEGEKAAAEKSAQIEKQQQDKARDITERAKSSAELSKKKAALAAKQKIIGDVIGEAKAQLHDLPDNEYFEILLKLAEKYQLDENGIMRLSDRDKKRLPADFEAKLSDISKGKIVIGQESAQIADGFLLIYGGIDINCSFDALFEDAAGDLQDIVSETIF